MELIIAFLLEKGGIFGLLFLLSLTYIYWTERTKDKAPQKYDKTSKDIEDLLGQMKSTNKRLVRLESQTKDLWEWHSAKDQDGVFVWYIKQSLQEDIKHLGETMKDDTEQLVKYSQEISKLNEGRVDELKSLLSDYNKTILDLTIALEKIRLTLENRE